MKFYKLLTQDMTSHNNTKWEVNKTITVTKKESADAHAYYVTAAYAADANLSIEEI